jgi:hypothetical protein
VYGAAGLQMPRARLSVPRTPICRSKSVAATFEINSSTYQGRETQRSTIARLVGQTGARQLYLHLMVQKLGQFQH